MNDQEPQIATTRNNLSSYRRDIAELLISSSGNNKTSYGDCLASLG